MYCFSGGFSLVLPRIFISYIFICTRCVYFSLTQLWSFWSAPKSGSLQFKVILSIVHDNSRKRANEREKWGGGVERKSGWGDRSKAREHCIRLVLLFDIPGWSCSNYLDEERGEVWWNTMFLIIRFYVVFKKKCPQSIILTISIISPLVISNFMIFLWCAFSITKAKNAREKISGEDMWHTYINRSCFLCENTHTHEIFYMYCMYVVLLDMLVTCLLQVTLNF